jgi:peptide/nickel transport system permease protein
MAMLRFIVKRLLLAILTLWAISAITFVLFFIVPSNPAYAMCGKNCTPDLVAKTQHALGLDVSKWQQYVAYNKGLVLGRDYDTGSIPEHCPAPCLGFSFRTHEPVLSIVGRALPVTISIVAGGAVLWLSIGIGLGMLSALRRGTVFDKTAIGFSLLGASMPVYFFGLIMLNIFVYTLKILPYPTYTPLFSNPAKWAYGLLLPWITLGFLNSAIYARLSRAQMLETLSEDFVRTARAVGLPTRTVYLRHAFRAAITPLVTIAGLDIGLALGGAVITESIFHILGMGYQAVLAVGDLNLPVVMATVLIAAFFIVASNLIVDTLYAVIDPRVKLA